ncbi:MAG: hypothetical protein DHS20C16_17900 [Phycisphaerae bacterium]|nr:MAG: hypothetical protein DHS20C16_17900 [Phycisphaerae bacterium]
MKYFREFFPVRGEAVYMLLSSTNISQLFGSQFLATDCGGRDMHGFCDAILTGSQPTEQSQLFGNTPQFWDSGP